MSRVQWHYFLEKKLQMGEPFLAERLAFAKRSDKRVWQTSKLSFFHSYFW